MSDKVIFLGFSTNVKETISPNPESKFQLNPIKTSSPRKILKKMTEKFEQQYKEEVI